MLIFDEIKTGFRFAPGGYQEREGIRPDLATFGKAMANGFPIAAVCGQRDVMKAARDTWISSTLAGEATALAATRAVLARHDESDVCETLAHIGRTMMSGIVEAIRDSGTGGVRLSGTPHMWLFEFDDPIEETRFLRSAIDAGVLFKRGAYNFPALAHDKQTVGAIVEAASRALSGLDGQGSTSR